MTGFAGEELKSILTQRECGRQGVNLPRRCEDGEDGQGIVSLPVPSMRGVAKVSLVTGVTVELCCLEAIPAFGNRRFSGVLGSEKLF